MRQAGVALLTAMALLVLFSALGAAYLKYMLLENQEAAFELRQLRGRHVARSGMQAALAEAAAALTEGKAPAAAYAFELPTYARDRQAPEGFSPHTLRRATISATVTEEGNRIDLNHAPAAVLQAVLGVDAAAAEAIAAARPGAAGASPEEALFMGGGMPTWFISVEDLVARGLLTEAQAAQVDPDLVTVFGVTDHAAPEAYLNVNTASPGVLAAALGIAREQAEAVAAGGPYDSVGAVAAAAGCPADSFPLPASALRFTPRTYRLIADGCYARLFEGKPYNEQRYRVEAVASFDADRAPRVLLWRETARVADEAEDGEEDGAAD